MQDTFLACHDDYQLLPVSSCLAPDSSLMRCASSHSCAQSCCQDCLIPSAYGQKPSLRGYVL